MVSKRGDSKYRSGPTTNWLKTKSFTVGEYELLGVERERGKPAFALVGKPGTRKYIGSAFVSINREMRERLWKRVQEHAGPPPKDMPKRPATQWVKAGDQGPHQASQGRRRPAPRIAAGFLGRGLSSDPLHQRNEDHRCKDQKDRHCYNHGKSQALCSPDHVNDLVARRNEIKHREIRQVRSLIVVCGSPCDLIDVLSALDKGHSSLRC
ncbi:hypothetical protein IQ26_00872 [Mesorhizobium tianshanense]|uniref:ATP-dependent DNA ligase n=2 Tax=Mesorhizobium tianshanense TaxID=39844 RepID=A0A562PC16_9HYPH|nr:hypothetical protein IQ26_00872 [Mesorhizobium tianshanense]